MASTLLNKGESSFFFSPNAFASYAKKIEEKEKTCMEIDKSHILAAAGHFDEMSDPVTAQLEKVACASL
jgi:hypothetical protein